MKNTVFPGGKGPAREDAMGQTQGRGQPQRCLKRIQGHKTMAMYIKQKSLSFV